MHGRKKLAIYTGFIGIPPFIEGGARLAIPPKRSEVTGPTQTVPWKVVFVVLFVGGNKMHTSKRYQAHIYINKI